MDWMKVKYFFLSFIICFAAAAIGSLVTFSAIPTWYASLHEPFFTPPNWLFGPVWTVLYVLMALSFYKILTAKKEKKSKKLAIYLFLTQLLLNILWSVLFFGFHQTGWSIISILYLWVSIFGMILIFSGIDKRAGVLQIPYLGWVTFATFLNISLFLLNK